MIFIHSSVAGSIGNIAGGKLLRFSSEEEIIKSICCPVCLQWNFDLDILGYLDYVKKFSENILVYLSWYILSKLGRNLLLSSTQYTRGFLWCYPCHSAQHFVPSLTYLPIYCSAVKLTVSTWNFNKLEGELVSVYVHPYIEPYGISVY